jgi:tRNA(Ile)-lysidine synthase
MRAGDRVCVAVSGGADSVALLRVLLELRAELGIVLSGAHFNHQLRGEASEADEAFVADLARRYELEFFTSCGDVRDHALTSKLSVEAAARELRYQWLASVAELHKLNEIATAHTLDDQAETVLLKFLRGAGTRGLAGVYPEIRVAAKEAGTRIVRPLLGVRRAEVEEYLTALGQEWREDESNLDYRFARNRVRYELLPLLEREYNPNIRRALSDLAEVSRGEEDYWQGLAERELKARHSAKAEIPSGPKPEDAEEVQKAGLPSAEADSFSITHGGDAGLKARSTRTPLFSAGCEAVPLQSRAAEQCPSAPDRRLSLVNFPALPLALQRRLLKRLLESEAIPADFEHIEKLLCCALGELANAELPGGWMAARHGECLELRGPQASPSFCGYEYRLPIPGEIHIAEIGATLRAMIVRQEFARENTATDSLLGAELLGVELTVRNWQPGDRFWPAHRKSEEKLKRLFSERHIPAEQRQSWPVVLAGEQIVWVRGFPVARAFVWKGSGDAVKIEML